MNYTPEFTQSQLPFETIEPGYCQCGCGQKTRLAPQSMSSRGWIKGEPISYITGHNNVKRTETKPSNRVVGQPSPVILSDDDKRRLAIRFWPSVQQGDPHECWLWTRGKDIDGYGRIMCNRQGIRTHRVAWILTCGDIPDDLHVLHNCPDGDNPSCCNPAHLWLGTNDDNIADKVDKGRQIHGEQVKNAKLTEEDVIEIRNLFAHGTPKAHIGLRFGVSATAITYIVRRKNWAHVP